MIVEILINKKEITIHLDGSGSPDNFIIDGEQVDFRTENEGTKFLEKYDDEICKVVNLEWLWYTRERVG